MNLSRRAFLQKTALTTAAARFTVATADAAAKIPRFKAGLGLNGFMSSSGAYKKTYPLEDVLEFAAAQRFDGIELVSGWPKDPYPAPDQPERVAALKALYDRHGLQIYTIQPTAGGSPYHSDKAQRDRWLGEYRGQIRLCNMLGCDFIGHWPGGDLQGNANVDQAIDRIVGSYRQAAKMCADAGIWMSFEIEPPFIFNKLEHLQRILAGVDHPACKTNYDPSHFDVMSGSKGKPEEMLKAVGVKYIGHVHRWELVRRAPVIRGDYKDRVLVH